MNASHRVTMIAGAAAVIASAGFTPHSVQAQNADLLVQRIHIDYQEFPEDPMRFIIRQIDTPEGRAAVSAAAVYFGISAAATTKAIAVAHLANDQTGQRGNEHNGIFRSPVGYSICHVSRTNLSITGGSTLNTRLMRSSKDNGLGYYIVVPRPRPGAGREWADGIFDVTFVNARPDIWNKYASKCLASNLLVTECKGRNCAPQRVCPTSECR